MASPELRLSVEIRLICQIYPHQQTSVQPLVLSVVLPALEEAHALFDKYTRDVDHFYHIIHAPSLQKTIHSLYSQVHVPDQIPLGQLVLVLCVLVSATNFWTEVDTDLDPRSTTDSVTRAGSVWTDSALRLIHYCQRAGHDSLEALQGITILAAVVGSIEGASHRHRCLLNHALTMARVLKLHTSDHPEGPGAASPVEAEVRRRVWWYLASTDW